MLDLMNPSVAGRRCESLGGDAGREGRHRKRM
jgi:hypothetical protein